ncbi:unnamed protein product [Rhizophagus irregularis]|nr:unnamed protein product [Rhizophagus irregularis]CAB5355408.1 unnamed protein product [Rhizophagus irregularis]
MRANNNVMINLEESHKINKKMRYSTGFGIFKKALNLAIFLNCDDELLGILYQFIDDKQRLIFTSTNNKNPNSEIFSIQVTDLLVVRKRETHNNSIAINKENKTLIDIQLQDESSANKYKYRVCGSFGYNAHNKRKCPQQNSL